MQFTKVQGTGNDFVLVSNPDNRPYNWPELAPLLCDRHFGIGADGILVLEPSQTADIIMRLFNADGSEAETCGNGLRCVAMYSKIHNLYNSSDSMTIETLAGIKTAVFKSVEKDSAIVQISMGIPEFQPDKVPVNLGKSPEKVPVLDYPVTLREWSLNLSMISMGNPHTVWFINEGLTKLPLEEIYGTLVASPLFPEGMNLDVAYVHPGSNRIDVRTRERGAGETMACGSGASAVTVSAILSGRIASTTAQINFAGGLLEIEWDGKGDVLLSGPAKEVFTGEWNL